MSSSDLALRVDGVGKCFRLYPRQRHRMQHLLMSPVNAALGRDAGQYYKEFWALRDISFEVMRGQTVGIIGQNGSGKSTLLQIITGTMMPTYGTVAVEGRVAALLELGSGFNPEFTGRENVFLNGTLLGLTRQQIEDKFDYIVSFAEIGEHLDHPVKTYSSGMMLRLAFAVQVAVESPVLIIDEALAVGDARFQLKCFRRLEELKANGTTILFVSHATELVRSFCDVGLVLEKGRAIYWGDAKVATVKYLAAAFPEQHVFDGQTAAPHSTSEPQRSDDAYILHVDPHKIETAAFGVGGAQLDWLEIHGLASPNIIAGGTEIRIRYAFSWDSAFIETLVNAESCAANITSGIAVADKKGGYIFGCNGFDKNFTIDCRNEQTAIIELSFISPYLAEGEYYLSVAIALGNLQQHTQLKWYDCMVPLHVMKGERNVFGALAIEYDMKCENGIKAR